MALQNQLNFKIMFLEEMAAGRARQIPSLLRTARGMLASARVYEEEGSNQEWAREMKRLEDGTPEDL